MATEIYLYGSIGDPAAKLDAATVTAQIRGATGDLLVAINSGGGLIFEGLPIYEALKAYTGGAVNVRIDGLAASMASIVAMAGDTITMADSALMMIHLPWDAVVGTANDLRQSAVALEKLEEQLTGIYASKSGMDPAVLGAMMQAETWFNATEAVAAGLATAIVAPMKKAAAIDLSKFGYRHVPPSILKDTRTMTTDLIEPMNATEITQIRGLVAAHGLGESVANEIFRGRMPMAAARAHILDALATAGDDARVGFGRGVNDTRGSQTLDDPSFHAAAVGEAIYCRLSGKAPQGAARELSNSSLVDLAREMIERRGVRNASRMRPNEVLDAATFSPRGSAQTPWGRYDQQGAVTHTTADFPGLLLSSGQRYLLEMYGVAESVLKTVCRERSARDFRSLSALRLSGFGQLPTINEGGEFTSGTLYERKESYAIATYGKMFSLSRQAMVNDDLGAFTDLFRIMGRAAAETEATILATTLMANPVMSDGKALFSPEHGNLKTPGSVPDVKGLDAMRQGLRQQKDQDGETILNVPAKYLVVPAGLETLAQNLTYPTAFNPTNAADANPFAGALVPLVEPRLSGPAWYGFADPNFAPIMEYAHLDGVPGPITESREGWSVLGMEFRVYNHFGCGITGFNGAYRNAGA